MKIAIIVSNPNFYGGGNKLSSDLIKIFKVEGFEAALCSWFKPVEGRCYNSFLEFDGVFLPSWFSRKVKGKLWKILFATCSAVKKCVESFEPDVVINADVEPAVFRVVPDNVVKIQYCHFPTEFKIYKHGLVHLVYRIPYWYYHYRELERLDAVVCNSNYTREIAYVAWGNYVPKGKFHVIYPMVDLKPFEKELPRENKMCYVGRIDPDKGIEHVISAFVKLHLDHGVKLAIVGGVSEKNREYYEYLKYLIEDMKRRGFPVEFEVNVPYEKIVETLLTSKIMVSYNEGEHFGIVPVESQAAGCVPIVADGGGQRETVRHGETGFRVKSPDEIVIYAAHLLRKDHKWKLMSERAREWVKEFSIEKISKKWIRLLEELI